MTDLEALRELARYHDQRRSRYSDAKTKAGPATERGRALQLKALYHGKLAVAAQVAAGQFALKELESA